MRAYRPFQSIRPLRLYSPLDFPLFLSSTFLFCAFPLFPLYRECNAQILSSFVIRHFFFCVLCFIYFHLLFFIHLYINGRIIFFLVKVLRFRWTVPPLLSFFCTHSILCLRCFVFSVVYELIISIPTRFVNTFFKIFLYFFNIFP